MFETLCAPLSLVRMEMKLCSTKFRQIFNVAKKCLFPLISGTVSKWYWLKIYVFSNKIMRGSEEVYPVFFSLDICG
jgi:hypothetical protein